MAEFLLLLVAAAALVAVAGCGSLLLSYTAYAGLQWLGDAAESLSARVGAAFSGLSEAADARARRRQVAGDIAGSLRPPGRGGIDQQFVAASAATRCVSASLKATAAAMETCCDIQRFTAYAAGVSEMADVEFDPICYGLRQKVTDTLDVTLEALEGYPGLFGDRRLLKQAIALRALRTVCVECELLRYSVAEAPVLCTPAASMNQKQGPRQGLPK